MPAFGDCVAKVRSTLLGRADEVIE